MKKTWPVLAALIGLFTVLGVGPVQAYPDTTPTIHLSVSDKVLVGGNSFTAKATADTNCAWTMTYRKQRATGAGTSIQHTFGTPVVKKRTKTTVTVTCAYDPTGAGRSMAGSQSTVSRSATVTLLPRKGGGHGNGNGGSGHGGKGNGGKAHHGADHHGDQPGLPNTGGESQAGPAHSDGGGLLPDTGGFDWWWLLVAAVLVSGGAAAVTRGRAGRAGR